MAGSRTVYRGSKGRFAGASGGRAEKVRVGSGYVRGSSPSAGNARPKPGRITQMRNKRAAARQANNVKPLNPNVKPRSRPAPAAHGHPVGLVNRSKPARIKYAATNLASHAVGRKAPGKVKFARNLAIGVTVGAGAGYLGAKAINASLAPGRQSKMNAYWATRGVRDVGPYKAKHAAQAIANNPTYRGIGVGRREVVSMPRTALRADATVGGRSVRSGAFVAGVGRAAGAMQGKKVGPNYSAAKGTREYVGRRLKPGEGRGFKLSAG